MNGIHDMGGMHGFGPVVPEENEPVFHHDWERRVLGVSAALIFTTKGELMDSGRSAIEQMEPAQYLATSYYEHWLHMLEHRLVAMGFITKDELAAGHLISSPKADAAPLSKDQAWPFFQHGAPTAMATKDRPRFRIGDRVLARDINPRHHTRLPRYARGRPATVVALRGAFPLPDALAQGLGVKPEQVYTVRFEAADLWGQDGEPREAVYLDMFDSYLEPAAT